MLANRLDFRTNSRLGILLICCIVLFTTYTSTGQTDIKNSFFWWAFLPVFLTPRLKDALTISILETDLYIKALLSHCISFEKVRIRLAQAIVSLPKRALGRKIKDHRRNIGPLQYSQLVHRGNLLASNGFLYLHVRHLMETRTRR
jgi:hypothetical protein